MLFKKLPGCDAASLPYILPLLSDSPLKEKPEASKIRESVLKILRQKDFSPATYILTLGQLLDLHKENLKDDLEFWRQYLQYVPLVGLENPN